MPMLKAPRPVSRRQELRQDVVVTGYARLVQLYDDYRTYFIAAGVGVVLLVLAGVGWGFYSSAQEDRAAEALGGIVRAYEQGNYRQALDGTADRPGLLEVAEEYDGTRSGNLAAFYAADALFRLGERDQALTYFQEFDKTEDFVSASAYAGEAAIYEDRGEFARASELYEEAAETYESPITSPRYLLRSALTAEKAGNVDRARELLEDIRDAFPDSPAAGDVEVHLARIGR